MSAYNDLLEKIADSWQGLLVEQKHDSDTHLALPNQFIAPSAHRVKGFVFREQFYWDTYFTLLGIADNDQELTCGMVDNLLYLFNKLGYIPNSNNKYHLGRSQPPLLSKMVGLVYENNQDQDWLAKAYEVIKQEYEQVWTGNEHPHNRKVYKGLSRYYHADQTHRGAEDESGWDYNTRFEDRALDYLPVDLNSFLYIYETDMVEIADKLGKTDHKERWQKRSERRQAILNNLTWDEHAGFYYDYDFVNHKRSPVKSLAAYTTMFSGLASREQAQQLVDGLSYFETDMGLATTTKTDHKIDGKQWAAPNGWAPLHYMVIMGLKRYEYDGDARRLAQKWVSTVNDKLKSSGKLFEKYNVVDATEPPASAVYPDQYGFAWTNGVSYRLIQDFDL